MNKVNWLLSAFILGLVFFFGCSSDTTSCRDTEPSSSSKPSSNSDGGSSSSGGGGIPDQDLVKKNVTLSSGKGYADLDEENPDEYTKEHAASNLDKIDIIAHCGTDNGYCESNSIYSPYSINLFYSLGNYIGGENIILYEVPATYADQFKTANRLSDISKTLGDLISALIATNCKDCVDEVPIAVGKVFLVQTSGVKWRVVIIKAAGDQSVDLEVILIPSN